LLDLVAKNQGPDQTKDQLELVIHDILGTDADKLQTLLLNEAEGVGVVFNLLNPHLGILVVIDLLAGNFLKQVAE